MITELIRPAPLDMPLKQIVYETFEWDELSANNDGFDSVSMSVSFVFEQAEPFTLSWRMWEPFECLTTLEMWQGSERDPFTRAWRELVVTAQPNNLSQSGEASIQHEFKDVSRKWANMLGARITGQYLAMGETGWGAIQPWSCRLEFDNGRSIVVCLGEILENGAPSYLPDSLLVTGSREKAMAYRPPGARASAWAE